MQGKNNVQSTNYSDVFIENVRYFNSIYRNGLVNAPICASKLQNNKHSCGRTAVSVITALSKTYYDFGRMILEHGE